MLGVEMILKIWVSLLSFTQISHSGTHEDSMYGTKLETIRSIHSEVWHNDDNIITWQFKIISLFLCILFQTFPHICFNLSVVFVLLQTLDGKNSFSVQMKRWWCNIKVKRKRKMQIVRTLTLTYTLHSMQIDF